MHAEQVIAPNLWVAAAFGNPWLGFALAIAILVWSVAIICWNYRRYHGPLVAALKVRLEATAGWVRRRATPRRRIASPPITTRSTTRCCPAAAMVELRHAWIEFGETFVDRNGNPLQATTRPEGIFLHLGDDTRVLA